MTTPPSEIGLPITQNYIDSWYDFSFWLTSLTFCAGMILGTLIAGTTYSSNFHHQALQHGAAEYNSTTGAWQWKQPLPPEKEPNHDQP